MSNRGLLLACLSAVAMLLQPQVAQGRDPLQPTSGPALDDRSDAGAAGADTEGKLTGLIDDAIRRLASARYSAAIAKIEAKDYPTALALLQQAEQLSPRDGAIVFKLAQVHHRLGNVVEAERFYRRAISLLDEPGQAYLKLADLLAITGASPERQQQALQLVMRARELLGSSPRVVLAQARVASRTGRLEQAERLYLECAAADEADNALYLEIGDFYRDTERDEQARRWYQRVKPESSDYGHAAAQRIFELEVAREARRFGWSQRDRAISPRARQLALRGRVLLNDGQLVEACQLLERALKLEPSLASAHADLGDAMLRRRRTQDAELAYLRALAIDPADPEFHARLGRFYLQAKGGKRASEAAMFLRRALELRPTASNLRLQLARAYQGAGKVDRAVVEARRFLSESNDAKRRAQAVDLLRALQGGAAEPAHGSFVSTPREKLSRRLVDALKRARAYLARGRPEEAMAELRRLPAAERGVTVLNLEAAILVAAGRPRRAMDALRASLRKQPSQAGAQFQLGLLLIEHGDVDSGRRYLALAEMSGEIEASYHLARLTLSERRRSWVGLWRDVVGVGQLIRAQHRLNTVTERAAASSLRKEAAVLQRDVKRRLHTVLVSVAGVCLLGVLLTVATWVRVAGGVDLTTLVRRHPELGSEVQRIMSAIRHEVLKHKTMLLAGLGEALAAGHGKGDEDADEKAVHLHHALFDEDGQGKDVVARLDRYVEQLRQLGRSVGIRLNLRRKDRATSPVLRGFAQLKCLAPRLAQPRRLSKGRRRRLARQIGSVSELLNTKGNAAIGQLIDQLRLLEVDRSLILSIFERTRGEPSLRAYEVATPQVEIRAQLPAPVAIPQQTLEDVLANLIRNAIEASGRDRRSGQIPLGLVLSREEDAITGIENLTIAVRDAASAPLTVEMLRDRPIDRGLGLTSELLRRYDGALRVAAAEQPWKKQVVVSLPIVERRVNNQ